MKEATLVELTSSEMEVVSGGWSLDLSLALTRTIDNSTYRQRGSLVLIFNNGNEA